MNLIILIIKISKIYIKYLSFTDGNCLYGVINNQVVPLGWKLIKADGQPYYFDKNGNLL